MQPTPKSNSVVTSKWDLATGILTIEVVGTGGGKIVFDARKWAGETAYDGLADNGKRALLHGIGQRLGDKAAIAKDKLNGQAASPAEKYEAIKGLADHYENGGDWSMKGDGLPALNRAALYEAIAVVLKTTAEKVEATYRSTEDTVLRTKLGHPDVAAEYTRRTVRKADSEKVKGMFAELEAAQVIVQPKLDDPTKLETVLVAQPVEKKNKGFVKQPA